MMKKSLTRILRATSAGVLLSASSVRADPRDSELILPRWEETPLQSFSLGGSLFPEGFTTDLSSPALEGAGTRVEAVTSEFPAARPDQDLSLFLPDALLGKVISAQQEKRPTPSNELRECSAPFLAACRALSQHEHVIDPAGHMTKEQREDMSRFLDFHARDARVKAFVMVIGRDEKLPTIESLAEIASGALSNGDACLAVYPVGEPWRARLFVNERMGQIAGMGELNAMADDCARDAAQVRDSLEQLHRFTVRLSIRLFWLERLMTPKQPLAETLAFKSHEKHSPASTASPPRRLAKATIDQARAIDWLSVVLGVALSLAGGGLACAGLRMRHRRNLDLVWLLPEIEIPQRLGGAFCGGGGATIQYR